MKLHVINVYVCHAIHRSTGAWRWCHKRNSWTMLKAHLLRMASKWFPRLAESSMVQRHCRMHKAILRCKRRRTSSFSWRFCSYATTWACHINGRMWVESMESARKSELRDVPGAFLHLAEALGSGARSCLCLVCSYPSSESTDTEHV